MIPSWNWEGKTLWEMWPGIASCKEEHTVVDYFWLQRYEPIEDEL